MSPDRHTENRANFTVTRAVFLASFLAVLFALSRFNFPLFHALVDCLSAVIACSIFVIIWNARRLLDNGYFLYAGIAFLFIAFFKIMHLLGNKGMGIFIGYGNLGPTFYIAGRYLLGISLMIAPLFIRRRLNTAPMFAVYSAVVLLVLLSIFYWRIFPVCIVEGVGLTPFKIVSDYVVCGMLTVAIFLLFVNRRLFDPKVLQLIILSIALSIVAGLTLSHYKDPFDTTNAVGHLFQILSFFLAYLAFVETGISKPQTIFYRQLKQSEAVLDEKVQQLDRINQDLRQEIAERKRAEQLLQESELRERQRAEELTVILDAVPIPVILVHDSESRHMTGNRAADALLKQPKGSETSLSAPPELRPRHFKAIKDQRELTLDELPAQRAAKGEEVRDFELRLIFNDGTIKDVVGYGTPLKDDQGKARGAVHALVDITERKKLEEALHRSEARQRLISTTAESLLDADDPQAILPDLCKNVMAYLGCQVFFNFIESKQSKKLRLNAWFGISDEEKASIEWLDYGAAVCGTVAQTRQRIIAEDIPCINDVRTELIQSYGVRAYCCHPLIAQKNLIGTLSFGTTTRDRFTEDEVEVMRIVAERVSVALYRKQIQEAVSQAKREWEKTFDAVPDLIAILDKNHTILRANRAMAERLNLHPAQCIGKDCHRLIHGLDRPPDFCPHAEALKDKRQHVAEVYEPSLESYFLVSSTPLFSDDEGAPIGSVHVARDITRAKQTETALREQTTALEAANRELESFSYSVSHDLRAPLRSINGFSSILLRDLSATLDGESRRKLSVIHENAQKMDQLIDNLLNLARLGQQAVSPVRLDMTRLFSEAWEELHESASATNVSLRLGELHDIRGDRALIKQVVLNLLSNALKYSRDRNPAVIEIWSAKDDNAVAFNVKDNGVGFDMTRYDKLFGVFRRLHSQTEFEGTGVGLAIAQRIIHKHGGRIWAEGEVGVGATFHFSLPL